MAMSLEATSAEGYHCALVLPSLQELCKLKLEPQSFAKYRREGRECDQARDV
eukprot:CAMPEP_0174749100 /NCGR_PEP_ID=MMETSP1094-20130205/95001_1 /TAXON_ID=156173 /ORGANISM="Chrysochromulina brevifilum, Strain UTEX LB 985" /LENGTH=51 /DNA_ID=CAMNT_0015954259 /DNA_START=156 /DNA_END=307 /DNA_ORIENTATION=-